MTITCIAKHTSDGVEEDNAPTVQKERERGWGLTGGCEGEVRSNGREPRERGVGETEAKVVACMRDQMRRGWKGESEGCGKSTELERRQLERLGWS